MWRPSKQEQWFTFISYSSREDEVGAIKPFVDDYIGELQRRGYDVCPIYYDGFYLRDRADGAPYSNHELESEIRKGIRGSTFTSAFLSPWYYCSHWCNFEWDETEAASHRISPILWKGWLPIEPPSPRTKTWDPKKFSRYPVTDIRELELWREGKVARQDREWGEAIAKCVRTAMYITGQTRWVP